MLPAYSLMLFTPRAIMPTVTFRLLRAMMDDLDRPVGLLCVSSACLQHISVLSSYLVLTYLLCL